MYERIVRPFLFLLPPESAHRVTVLAARVAMAAPPLRRWVELSAIPRRPRPVHLFGLTFRNPVGLAAGFDKNARYTSVVEGLGFGFIEVGSVTARAWPGNARPRLFRLPGERALVNRMGLGNEGADAIAQRLAAVRRRLRVPLFVNVAQTPDPALNLRDGIADYVYSVQRTAPHADAVVLNVSCPNTEGGKTFEDPAMLDRLLAAVRATLVRGDRPPLLVKISSDIEPATLRESVAISLRHGVDGFVAVNTTTDRSILTPAARAAADAMGAGGLSGAPLRGRALDTIRALREATSAPIIGVGGIFSAGDVRAMLAAGANLVEAYTGFVYGGPLSVRRWVDG